MPILSKINIIFTIHKFRVFSKNKNNKTKKLCYSNNSKTKIKKTKNTTAKKIKKIKKKKIRNKE